MGNFDDLLRLMFGGCRESEKLDAPVITCSDNVVTMTGMGVIRYTTDGTTPTSSSTMYSGAITINADTTFKAYCSANGMTDSDVTTFTAIYIDSTYKSMYFYVEDTSGSNNTMSIKKIGEDAPDVTVYTSTNQTAWSLLGTTSTTELTATVPANGKLYLKAVVSTWALTYFNQINCSGSHNVGGNIMSLIYGDNFLNQTTIETEDAFKQIFHGDSTLVSAEHLILPATTLSYGSYHYMFELCSSLTTPPKLPATTLESACYAGMFYCCYALSTAPILPARVLSTYCYNSMFSFCRSLTTAPELPAETLVQGCYGLMFEACSSLTYIKALFTTEPSNTYTRSWVQNVASSGTFVKNANAEWSVTGNNGVPTNWTIQTA